MIPALLCFAGANFPSALISLSFMFHLVIMFVNSNKALLNSVGASSKNITAAYACGEDLKVTKLCYYHFFCSPVCSFRLLTLLVSRRTLTRKDGRKGICCVQFCSGQSGLHAIVSRTCGFLPPLPKDIPQRLLTGDCLETLRHLA